MADDELTYRHVMHSYLVGECRYLERDFATGLTDVPVSPEPVRMVGRDRDVARPS